MRHDVAVIGLYILDVLGRPVSRIPERGGVDFIEEIRLTVAGTAGGTVIDTAKLGLRSLARFLARLLWPCCWIMETLCCCLGCGLRLD